jgi:nitrogen fixation NifU-like protein
MTEMVKGKDLAEAGSLLQAFASLLNGRTDVAANDVVPEHRAIVATVRKYPARARCAHLPWATLEAALDDRQEAVLVR